MTPTFKPRLTAERHISRGRDIGPIWYGLMPDGSKVSCGAIRGLGGDVVFRLDEALAIYKRQLTKKGGCKRA